MNRYMRPAKSGGRAGRMRAAWVAWEQRRNSYTYDSTFSEKEKSHFMIPEGSEVALSAGLRCGTAGDWGRRKELLLGSGRSQLCTRCVNLSRDPLTRTGATNCLLPPKIEEGRPAHLLPITRSSTSTLMGEYGGRRLACGVDTTR